MVPFKDAICLTKLGLYISVTWKAELDVLLAVAQTPNLQRLNWMFLDDSYVPSGEILFPWNRLTHISITESTYNAAPIVPHCTSAVTLNLHMELVFPLHRQPEVPIPLYALKGLELLCHRDGFRLLRELECPNLEVLILKINEEDRGWSYPEDLDDCADDLWERFFAFFKDSIPNLRVLQIEDVDGLFTPELLTRLVAKTLRLEKLWAWEMTIGNEGGWVVSTVEDIRGELGTSGDILLDRILDREEMTMYGGSLAHVGYVWEIEWKEFLKERDYMKELHLDMNKFQNLLHL
ncbi:hypothetical protein P691DRAFT_771900 [Macrolepiota fuliginosa MF-IS2]|uniref:Uncharacterized protein n=1 Tax=Macrolepiota fuliginosa MF-IS2 TaxID=1400762 RepID=A0A9P5XLE5_9AGAR|nr:hypothetical protein P691DRAFT_771900 [Macrolepiota fuliginosa MF-IS2]